MHYAIWKLFSSHLDGIAIDYLEFLTVAAMLAKAIAHRALNVTIAPH